MRHLIMLLMPVISSIALAHPINGSPELCPRSNGGTRDFSSVGFEENKGQVRTAVGGPAPFVHYQFKQGNTSIFLLNDGIAYQFNRTYYAEGYLEPEQGRLSDRETSVQREELRAQVRLESFRMDMVLEGANAAPLITAEGKRPDYTNYHKCGALGVHTFTRIIYHDVYPGIDWVVYMPDAVSGNATLEGSTGSSLKYDFVVHPGANPGQIRLFFKHHEELRLDSVGRLVHGNRMGRFIEAAPVSYQDGQPVRTQFVLEDDHLRFALSGYDPTRTLTIDPERIWGTYYGGTSSDNGFCCAVDSSGNVYLAGFTGSTTGIGSGGHQDTLGGDIDAFLVKFNPDGVRIWGSYFGGAGEDMGHSCAVDTEGNVYLAGKTHSSEGIASGGHQDTLAGYHDAFLVKFDPNGVRLWGTYFGGSYTDIGYSCAVAPSGSVYLTGYTKSATGIASEGFQDAYGGGLYDAFLVKFNPDGTRLWATYYGGTGAEDGISCVVDAGENVYLAGETYSIENIATDGHQNTFGGGGGDAFLVKFDPEGVRLWATYYGGDSGEQGNQCVVDPAGNVYLAGWTGSSSGIAMGGHQNTFGGGYRDAFLVKFDPSGTRLWGTYYGGPEDDTGHSCDVDNTGTLYLAGITHSASGIADSGYDITYGGSVDAYLVKFDPDGIRFWGTYYGGSSWEYGYWCTIDPFGAVYLAGPTASQAGIASGGHQNTYGDGVTDAYLVKFDGGGSTGVVWVPEASTEVMPNPTNDSVRITTVRTGQRFAISDATGRALLGGLILTRTHQVSLGCLPTGVYLLKVWDQQGTEVIRLVKE